MSTKYGAFRETLDAIASEGFGVHPAVALEAECTNCNCTGGN